MRAGTIDRARLHCAGLTHPAPREGQSVAGTGEAKQIGRLRVTPQHLHRQYERKLREGPSAAESHPSVNGVHPQG